jgi:RNA polymerase sigma factor (sigma-70 family)
MENNNDENMLVQQVLSGNRKAFELLVQRYEKLVLHIVTPLVGINADREDLCQDIFIKVYKSLNTFQFRSRLSTWIGNIAYNTCVNFIQKKRHNLLADVFTGDLATGIENGAFDVSAAGVAADPEEIFIKKQEIKYLAQAIEQLPVLQKTILLLFHQDGLSLQEISNIFELPVNTVKSHLFRARKSLKEQLNQK